MPEAVSLAEMMVKAKLREVTPETPDTVTYSFELSDGRGPADFRPGRFNMLYVHGVGEAPISIASWKHEKLLKHTVRSVGSVTNQISKLKVGESLGLRGPYGKTWPVEAAYGKQLVIAAGGLGLAPLRPVILEALSELWRFADVKILYGAKTPQDLLYRYEYRSWGRNFMATVDKGDENWKGNVGVVTTLFNRVEVLSDKAVAFVCGPEVMMKFTVQELLRRRVPEDNIYVSLERHMQCGMGTCGHCQLGPVFVCKDGPVFGYPQVKRFFAREGV